MYDNYQGYGNQGYQRPQPIQQPVQYVPLVTTNAAPPGAKGKATASLVLGIISVVLLFFPLIGLICGIIALALSSRARSEMPLNCEGRGMATAGLVLGTIGTIFGSLYLIANIIWIIVAISKGAAYWWLLDF